MPSHDWHMFDEANGYEVSVLNKDAIHLRKVNEPDHPVIVLNAEQFERLREPGPNPRGLA